jgi:hypothetical protein
MPTYPRLCSAPRLLNAVYFRRVNLPDRSLTGRDRPCHPELRADVPPHAVPEEPPISLAVRSTMEVSYGTKR